MKQVVAPRSPRALTAIAAVLALSAIPAVAQEAQPSTATPSLSLPQDVTTGSPATPTVTLPPEATAPTSAPGNPATTAGTSPQPTAPAPVIAATPTTAQQTVVLPDAAPPATPDEAAADPAPARTTTRTAAGPRAAAPAERAEARPTVPTAQDNGTAADGALAEGSVPPAAPAAPRADTAPPAADTAPPPVADSGNDVPVAEIAGILAALGVAGLGIFAMRRRREPVYEEVDTAPQPLELVGTAEPVPPPAPVVEAIEPAMPEPAIAERPYRAPAVAGAGATAILAASPLPATAEERYELLDRMAAAAPDEGNPFTSRKGRLRRARLQLQHRERLEAEGKAGDRFDFRTYRPTKAAGTSTPAPRELTEA